MNHFIGSSTLYITITQQVIRTPSNLPNPYKLKTTNVSAKGINLAKSHLIENIQVT